MGKKYLQFYAEILCFSKPAVFYLLQELQYEFRMDDTPIYKDTIAGWLGNKLVKIN